MQGLIKVILNLFSRKFLIKISLILKPFFELIFRGNRFVDPINNKSYSYFFPYGYNKLRKNALSPGTLSLERHRLLWIFLEKETDFFNTENKNDDKSPPKLGRKGFSEKLVINIFFTDCFTAAASDFLNTSPFAFFAKVKSTSLYDVLRATTILFVLSLI